MSKLRMTVSRLLALGGLTAASGSGLAFYKYSLLNGDSSSIAECRRANPAADFVVKDTDPLHKDTKIWNDNWDFRKDLSPPVKEPKVPILDNDDSTTTIPVSPRPTATRHVVLVRHGQYVYADKDKQRVLTELGRQQASATGQRLKSMNFNFDKVTVSTMTRAQETANIIGESIPDVPFTECSLLREGAPYPPEPPSSRWKPEQYQFFKDNPRIEGAFRKYIHRADPSQKEDSYELIVCHANVIRYFVCRALQFPPEGWLRMSIGNCGITWLSIRPNGRVSLRGLGDTGHLPPDMVTFS